MYNWIILLYTWNKQKIVINYTSIKKILISGPHSRWFWLNWSEALESWFVKDFQVQRSLRTTVQKDQKAARGICDQRLWAARVAGEIYSWIFGESGSHLSVVSRIFSVMKMLVVVVVQLPSHVWLFATPWTAARQASLFLTISQSLPKFMPIESVMPLSHLILCHSLLLPSIFLSIRVLSSELTVNFRWPNYWSLSFSTSPSSEYSGLTSFKLTGLTSLRFKGLSRVFFSTIIWKHDFFGAQPSLWSISHICIWLLERL